MAVAAAPPSDASLHPSDDDEKLWRLRRRHLCRCAVPITGWPHRPSRSHPRHAMVEVDGSYTEVLMGGGARRGRSGFRRQRPVGRRVVLSVTVHPPSGDMFSSCSGAIGQRVPARMQNPDRTLANARSTARSRRAAGRGPLIRLPDAAFGEPLLRSAARSARRASQARIAIMGDSGGDGITAGVAIAARNARTRNALLGAKRGSENVCASREGLRARMSHKALFNAAIETDFRDPRMSSLSRPHVSAKHG